MKVNYYYYIGPYKLENIGGVFAWSPPTDFIGSIDLRNLSKASNTGSPGIGFFVTNKPLTSEYTLVGRGHLSEIFITQRSRDAFLSLTNYLPQGDTLAQCIFDILTSGSDPTWLDSVKSLMPCNNNLEVCIFGHDTVFRRKFLGPNDQHWNKIQTIIKEDYRKIFTLAKDKKTNTPEDLDEKYLGYLIEKYKLKGIDDWKLLVPQDLIQQSRGPKKPTTTLTDNFDRANANPISANGAVSWTEVNGTSLEINSNQAFLNTGTTYGRYESDLSTDDMSVSADVDALGSFGGVLARHASAADTSYVGRIQSGSIQTNQVFKRVTGTLTKISESSTAAYTLPVRIKLDVDGSTLQFSVDSVIKLGPFTDTSITGNTRAGIYGTASARLDDWQAEDTTITALTSTVSNPGTIVNGGTGALAWVTPENASTSNNVYAVATAVTDDETEYLKATNFGFTIPTDATINGVMVSIERVSSKNTSTDNVLDEELKLVKGGVISGNDLSNQGASATVDRWQTSDTTWHYGGAGELWGLTLTPSDVNSTDFGLAFRCSLHNDPATIASVDALTLTVFYTEAAGTTHEGSSSILLRLSDFGSAAINISGNSIIGNRLLTNTAGNLVVNNYLNFLQESQLYSLNTNDIVNSSVIRLNCNKETIGNLVMATRYGGFDSGFSSGFDTFRYRIFTNNCDLNLNGNLNIGGAVSLNIDNIIESVGGLFLENSTSILNHLENNTNSNIVLNSAVNLESGLEFDSINNLEISANSIIRTNSILTNINNLIVGGQTNIDLDLILDSEASLGMGEVRLGVAQLNNNCILLASPSLLIDNVFTSLNNIELNTLGNLTIGNLSSILLDGNFESLSNALIDSGVSLELVNNIIANASIDEAVVAFNYFYTTLYINRNPEIVLYLVRSPNIALKIMESFNGN